MRNPYFLFAVFGIIGLPFLFIGLFFTFGSLQKATTWESTNGVITSVGQNSVEVKFEYNGNPFNVTTNFTEDNMIEGDTIDVYFPVGHPEQAEVKTFLSNWLFSLIFLFFGLTFGSIGFFGVRSVAKKAKAKKELFTEQRGKKLSGLSATVTLNRNYSVNNQHPFVIDASWTDPITQVNHTFRSENLWVDPTPQLRNGAVDVYIDEADLKRYYVDVTFLPGNT